MGLIFSATVRFLKLQVGFDSNLRTTIILILSSSRLTMWMRSVPHALDSVCVGSNHWMAMVATMPLLRVAPPAKHPPKDEDLPQNRQRNVRSL